MWVLLTVFAVLAVTEQSPSRPVTVLLIPVDAKSDKLTEDYKTAFPLTTRENGVLFDLDGNGQLEQVAWTQASNAVAFLAIDKNENGIIDNGNELVGNRVVEEAANAINALSKMPQSQDDANQGGPAWINEADPVYKQLLLWRDANHNGVSDANELRPVSEVLTKIGLGYARFNHPDDHGNLFEFHGWRSCAPNRVRT